jgi:hypothetical protein
METFTIGFILFIHFELSLKLKLNRNAPES